MSKARLKTLEIIFHLDKEVKIQILLNTGRTNGYIRRMASMLIAPKLLILLGEGEHPGVFIRQFISDLHYNHEGIEGFDDKYSLKVKTGNHLPKNKQFHIDELLDYMKHENKDDAPEEQVSEDNSKETSTDETVKQNSYKDDYEKSKSESEKYSEENIMKHIDSIINDIITDYKEKVKRRKREKFILNLRYRFFVAGLLFMSGCTLTLTYLLAMKFL